MKNHSLDVDRHTLTMHVNKMLQTLAMNNYGPAQYEYGKLFAEDNDYGFMWMTNAAYKGIPNALVSVIGKLWSSGRHDDYERAHALLAHMLSSYDLRYHTIMSWYYRSALGGYPPAILVVEYFFYE